ncbi:MAG: hypothetical protein ACR2JK_03760, partial [Geodermatophilaceae bacterium]
FHRDVPLYGGDGPDRASGRYNYAIAPVGSGRDAVAIEDGVALLRLGPAPCVPDPAYSDRIPK